MLQSVGVLDEHRLRLLGVGTFVYAAVFLTEGVALLTRRPWAEWLTVGVTASFVPLEVWETVRHFTPLKLAGIAVNVAIVVYLVLHVRSRKRAASTGDRRAMATPIQGSVAVPPRR